MVSPPPENYVVRYYVHNKTNYNESKVLDIKALQGESAQRVIDRINEFYERTRSLSVRISSYVAKARKQELPAKQARRNLKKLNEANKRLEEERDAA